MNWIVKIDGKPELRILVQYNPVLGKVSFIGEFRYKSKWTEFYTLEHNLYHLDSEKINEFLFNTYNGLDNRVNVLKSLHEKLDKINLIEIKED